MYEPMYQGYTSRSSSRLPPIHAIGKSKPVDEDEPPDIPLEAYGFDPDGNQSLTSVESVFEPSDAEDVCKLLRKAFHMLGPGRHACKRNPDHGGSHFVHCKRAVRLGGYYSRLRRLLEERAWMELTRDCVFRLRSAQIFLEELEGLLNAEYRTAYAIRHGCVLEAPVSKLYCLNGLCEDLRVHVGHWNSIKQRVNTNQWLQPLLGFLCRDLAAVQRTFMSLCDRAIFVMDRLVHVGFEVLAHCDPAGLTPDILWNITRGLEDFNNIVSTYRMHSSVEGVQTGGTHNPPDPLPSHPCPYLHPAACSPPGRLSDGIRSIPFQKVLAILANERSRYAGQLTHRFFTANEAFLATLTPSLTSLAQPFPWDDDLGSAVSAIHLHSRAVNREGSPEPGRGGLHLENCDVRGSQASLSGAMLHVGNLRVPDLSSLRSPLVEFSQDEQQFADSFLQIVCTSTSLLRKNNASSNNSRSRSRHRQDPRAPPMSPVVGRPPKVQGDTPVLSRSDSRRKTVSWGDNADTSIRSQVVAMYMDVLWQHFGRNLDLFLDEPAWVGKVGLLQSQIGTIFLYGDSVIATVRHMVEHICMKDMFPPGSVSALLGVVVRLHALSAFAAWDSFLSGANSIRDSEKCYPYLLPDDRYSTHCGHLLRSSFRPLLSLLQELSRSVPHSRHESCDLIPQYGLDLSLVSGVSSRLLSSCRLSHTWCTDKLHMSLASWNIKAYLFVSNTDLKMLLDISQRSVQLLQTVTSGAPSTPHTTLLDQLSLTHITDVLQQCSLLNTQLQNLEGSALNHFTEKLGVRAASFFQEYLPPAKLWRRKVPAEFPEDPNSYVGQLWESLLAPVMEGVVRLPVSGQLEVLTAVITSVCTAWTAAFLREKTKFSLFGAQQLGVDFETMRTSFSNTTLAADVRRAVPELSIFRQLGGIVQLLKRQPLRRPTGRFRDCSTEDLSCETRAVNHSPSASRSELPANMEESHDASDVCLVPNPEEWLSLRAIGGTRSWRFPSCFGADSSQR
ncbi:uncharacterized protein [Littorina saxatilis]|uniref:Coiled-coil protein 142 C-terminal domain-containing protein n=1 Tax=Littorina saxatilis TaxID=31220 RepID=A0AAN9GIS1_9CAEN